MCCHKHPDNGSDLAVAGAEEADLRAELKQAERGRDDWQEEAKRYAGNADYWRERVEQASKPAERKGQDMTFYEFTHRPPTPEGEMLLQSIAIISGQEGFRDKSPDEIFAFVETQAANVKATTHDQ